MQMIFRQPSFFLIVGYVCTAFWLPSPGIAQESQSVQEISGVVKDATGGVLPGVQVSIPDLKLSADTDNSGRYTLKNVPAGKMILQASLPGF
jgi:hypothetical protein